MRSKFREVKVRWSRMTCEVAVSIPEVFYSFAKNELSHWQSTAPATEGLGVGCLSRFRQNENKALRGIAKQCTD